MGRRKNDEVRLEIRRWLTKNRAKTSFDSQVNATTRLHDSQILELSKAFLDINICCLFISQREAHFATRCDFWPLICMLHASSEYRRSETRGIYAPFRYSNRPGLDPDWSAVGPPGVSRSSYLTSRAGSGHSILRVIRTRLLQRSCQRCVMGPIPGEALTLPK